MAASIGKWEVGIGTHGKQVISINPEIGVILTPI